MRTPYAFVKEKTTSVVLIDEPSLAFLRRQLNIRFERVNGRDYQVGPDVFITGDN